MAVTRFCEAPGVPTVGGTKNPDVAAIAALSPDLVVMDKEENRVDDAEALQASGVTVHVTHVRAVEDVAPTLARPGGRRRAGGDPRPRHRPGAGAGAGGQRAARLGADLAAAVDDDQRRHLRSSILAAAGIGNVCEDAADPYPTVTLEAAAGLRPDVVLAPSEPYPFAERHRAELEAVAPVVFVDGQDLFWWGSRTPAALARLRQLAAGVASR